MSLIDFQRAAQLDASPPCSSCCIFLPASTPQCFCRTRGSGPRRCTSRLRHWQEDAWKEREIGRLSIRKASLHFLTEAANSQNSEDDERNNSVQEKNLMKLLYFQPFLCYKEAKTGFSSPHLLPFWLFRELTALCLIHHIIIIVAKVYIEHLSYAGLHARSLICIIVPFYHKPLGSGWVPKNWYFWTVELEKTLVSPLYSKEINQCILKEINSDIHQKDWCWSWRSNTLAFWCEELTHWKKPWCWGRLRAGGEVEDRGWDGWMASPTQWIWVWQWRTGKPGVLQSMVL